MSAELAPEATQNADEPLVPAGGRFVGVLVFRGRARIDGEVVGPVEGEGCLLVGADAKVSGPVSVGELIVSGTIEGDVSTRVRAQLDAGATLRGTLVSPRLAVANGALIQGRCSAGSAFEEPSGESRSA